MSMRSITRVFDGGEELVALYRHHDGYPSGHGVALAEFVASKRIVNGYSSAAKLPTSVRINGAGRMASAIIIHFEENELSIVPPDVNAGQEYEYHVMCPGYEELERAGRPADGLPMRVESFSVSGGYGDKPIELKPISLNEEEQPDAG